MPSLTPAGAADGGAPEGGPGRGSPGRPILAAFDKGFSRQGELCRDLEELADSLPNRLDTHRALLVAGRLHTTLGEVHRFEETEVFPALLGARGGLGPVLDRLRAEHANDEDAAGDLEDALAAFAVRRDGGGAEARRAASEAERIGYMLRSLFTGLRRHVAHDREVLRPVLRDAG